MIVVSDPSPLCYLVLMDLIDVLPLLYGKVIIPKAVSAELSSKKAPLPVQKWIARSPSWLEVHTVENIQISDALKNYMTGRKKRSLWQCR